MWPQRVVKWADFSAGTELAVQLCRHRFRARTGGGPSDRLDERQRGPAEVACGGVASLVGKGTTVCGNKSRSQCR